MQEELNNLKINIMMKFNPSTDHWYEKPPVIVQNIGDALQSGALFLLGYVSLDGDPNLKYLAIIALVMGVFGIMIQKLFKDVSAKDIQDLKDENVGLVKDVENAGANKTE